MDKKVVDLKEATHAGENPAATRNGRSHIVSSSIASATKLGMATVADSFMDEYTDVFDELSKREACSDR